MRTALLDTSALMVFFFKEPGFEVVQKFMDDPDVHVTACSVTLFEFRYAMKLRGVTDQDGMEAIQLLGNVFDSAVPVDLPVVKQAIRLRDISKEGRLPAMDAIIAAAAVCAGATLIHRDDHISMIPVSVLKQIRLPDRKSAMASPDPPGVVRERASKYGTRVRGNARRVHPDTLKTDET